jgi:biopolymer transport protein ExbB
LKPNVLLFSTVVLIALSAAGLAYGETAAPSGDSLTAWQIVMKGGWTMIPLALLSVAAVGIAFHIFLLLDPKSIIPSSLVTSLVDSIGQGKLDEARNTAERNGSVAGRIFAAGLGVVHFGPAKVEELLTNTGRREMGTIRRRIAMLGYIGQLSPLLGLLGTVLGMIKAFRVVSLSSDPTVQSEKAFLLAGAIWEAMVTTAAGLIVGIFAFLLFYYFTGRLQKLSSDLEAEAEKFALALNGAQDASR